MIRQTQIDGLIAWFRSEIDRLKSELESPVYSYREEDGSYYTDSALPLLERLERAESDVNEAENFEFVDDVPAASPNRAAMFAVNAVAVIGGMFIGMMAACCFLYTDHEIANQALDFWRLK